MLIGLISQSLVKRPSFVGIRIRRIRLGRVVSRCSSPPLRILPLVSEIATNDDAVTITFQFVAGIQTTQRQRKFRRPTLPTLEAVAVSMQLHCSEPKVGRKSLWFTCPSFRATVSNSGRKNWRKRDRVSSMLFPTTDAREATATRRISATPQFLTQAMGLPRF